jgi:chorismate synthase
MNQFGERFRLSLFGESHGEGVGVVMDGVPPGLSLSAKDLQADLDQRRPGQSRFVSARREPDVPRILSGVHNGRSTGAPLCVWIENRDAQSKPYEKSANVPRPGHADWVSHVWSRGFADLRGGGHFSGRLTAPLVAAGTVAQKMLGSTGIVAAAHLHQVHDVAGPVNAWDARAIARKAAASSLHTAHAASLGKRFANTIESARKAGDSVGGIIEFRAEQVPVAWGAPFFGSFESQLAHLLFAVPAVKGVSFGAGFAAAAMKGSQHNDPYRMEKGKVAVDRNNAGGILGGLTTGAPVWGHVAVKPSSSIFLPQETVDLSTGKDTVLELTGRHDPCIAVRAVPVVQACLRIVLADFLLLARQQGLGATGTPAI